MWNVLWILLNPPVATTIPYMMPLCQAKHEFPLLILQTVTAGNTIFCHTTFSKIVYSFDRFFYLPPPVLFKNSVQRKNACVFI